MRLFTALLYAITYTVTVTLLTGCHASSFLSGSASMRIEVDVYKGPLSQEAAIQKGQLRSLLRSSDDALRDLDGQLMASMCRIGCVRGDDTPSVRRVAEISEEDADGEQTIEIIKSCCKGDTAKQSPADVLEKVIPTYSMCAGVGMPQRRVLKTGWIFEPYEGKYNQPLSGKLDENENGYIIDNRNNYLLGNEYDGRYQRFPDLMPPNHNVCQVYMRLRQQVGGIRIKAANTICDVFNDEDDQTGSGNKCQCDDANTESAQCKNADKQRDSSAPVQVFSTSDLALVADLAVRFRILAIAISYQITAVEPPSKRLLIDLGKAANLAAEFANQLTSRANALAWREANKISDDQYRSPPTSQFLRDAGPTAFLEIYDWLGATTDSEHARERVNIVKRLFDDDNWSRVNEVYASGAGDTSMAFILDEIGNWNLKSFENDPAELIQAYTSFSTQLVEKAVSLVASGGTAQAARLVTQAQQAQSGQLLAPSAMAPAAAADGEADDTITASDNNDSDVAKGSAAKGNGLIAQANLETIREALVAELKAAHQKLTADSDKTYPFDQLSDGQKMGLMLCMGVTAASSDSEKLACTTAVGQRELANQAQQARTNAENVVQRYRDLIEALQTAAPLSEPVE